MGVDVSQSRRRVAVIGAGPAGLSLARLLDEQGLDLDITLFEKDKRVGGKCMTEFIGDHVVEFGTCYTTRAHRRVLKWMRQLSVPIRYLKGHTIDGQDMLAFVSAGSGPPLPVQMMRYLGARRRLLSRIDRGTPSKADEVEAAEPVLHWLKARDLGKIEQLMYRLITSLGYGYLDDVSTLQALRWIDLDLAMTGALRQTSMPVPGWETFWRKVAKTLKVETDAEVISIDRSGCDIVVMLKDGRKFQCDELVCAIPLDQFTALLSRPSDAEARVNDAVDWGRYTTTLIAAENWFVEEDIMAFSAENHAGADLGRMVSARREGYEMGLGGMLYITGQNSGLYSEAELAEIVRNDIAAKGATLVNIIRQKTWKYFPKYKRAAIAGGLVQTMRDMQGQNRTWYTGATFSHEAVSNIVNFNVTLARQMARPLRIRDRTLGRQDTSVPVSKSPLAAIPDSLE